MNSKPQIVFTMCFKMRDDFFKYILAFPLFPFSFFMFLCFHCTFSPLPFAYFCLFELPGLVYCDLSLSV